MTLYEFRRPLVIALTVPLLGAQCDRDAESDTGAAPPAAGPAVESPMTPAATQQSGEGPDEIYFDLTAFPWYREGRPLMHNGRPYMPQADPTPVDGELREAGMYEGVKYYVPDDAAEPVYTVYVPVYYRYWQRFTAPPGA